MAVDTGTVPVWPVLVTLWTWNSLHSDTHTATVSGKNENGQVIWLLDANKPKSLGKYRSQKVHTVKLWWFIIQR